ncbi:MAG: CPBP family intramembrane metalloprotease [Bacteroidales bacterium]|nr:CPBP family intramembrane metalloprotease [Bacteroidales bacterium]
MKRSRKANYDLFSSYAYYTPGFGGIGALLLWFIAGAVLGSIVGSVFVFLIPGQAGHEYMILVSYPLMFIPPMMYANLKSKRNAFFDTGYALSSDNYGRIGGFRMALLVSLATLAAAYLTDACSELLPATPAWFDELMGSMVGGTFWINFLCVSIFAPLFEEWLCRGEVLRGLLNYRKADGSRGIKPGWAIVLSALFFAAIHGNPWQAVPAFGLGCLFGYVYYRTGSLKLTMLMHCVNNTFSLLMSRIDSLSDVEHYSDIFPSPQYWLILGACVLLVLLSIRLLSTIELKDRQGNCDEVRAA